MLPGEELAAKAKKLGEGLRRIVAGLREIRVLICPESVGCPGAPEDDPLVILCNKMWDEYRQGTTDGCIVMVRYSR